MSLNPFVRADINPAIKELCFPNTKVLVATFLERVINLKINLPEVHSREIIGGNWEVVKFSKFKFSIVKHRKIEIENKNHITHCKLLKEQFEEFILTLRVYIERLFPFKFNIFTDVRDAPEIISNVTIIKSVNFSVF